MTAQYSDHFCLSLPEWTAWCHEDSLQGETTSSKAVTADVAANDKHFNHFLSSDKATSHVPEHNNTGRMRSYGQTRTSSRAKVQERHRHDF